MDPICAIGSSDLEKTTLIRRFAEGKFTTNYLPTLGVDITTKKIQVDDNNIKLILVDTAGQEFFGKLRPSYYRGASACTIFFSLHKRE
ncbi:MAG: Rab family GTPase, partial [Candidatus Hodarchaeales archaeon]